MKFIKSILFIIMALLLLTVFSQPVEAQSAGSRAAKKTYQQYKKARKSYKRARARARQNWKSTKKYVNDFKREWKRQRQMDPKVNRKRRRK